MVHSASENELGLRLLFREWIERSGGEEISSHARPAFSDALCPAPGRAAVRQKQALRRWRALRLARSPAPPNDPGKRFRTLLTTRTTSSASSAGEPALLAVAPVGSP